MKRPSLGRLLLLSALSLLTMTALNGIGCSAAVAESSEFADASDSKPVRVTAEAASDDLPSTGTATPALPREVLVQFCTS